MEVFKCLKCGKTIEVKKAKEMDEIKCGHCNKVYVLDQKTNKRLVFWGVFFIVVLSFFAAMISQLFNISLFISVLPLMLLGFYGKPILVKFLYKLNKINYEAK